MAVCLTASVECGVYSYRMAIIPLQAELHRISAHLFAGIFQLCSIIENFFVSGLSGLDICRFFYVKEHLTARLLKKD